METSVARKIDNHRFPLSFYYRLADQLINQAKVYRDEQSITDLYTTLNRYCSLVSKIPQHQGYLTYSAKEKLHHNKMHQEFIKELKILKPLLGYCDWAQMDNVLPSHSERKVNYCGVAQTKSQSFSILYKENIGLASVITVESSTSYPTAISGGVNGHTVTQSPSPVLSCIQSVPDASCISQITTADSRHGYSSSSYQDIHISSRLMEDFLELARDNTDKDLETCGLLGAFLKDGVFYATTLIIPKQESTSSSCQALNEEEIYAIQDEHSLFPVGWIHTHPSQTCFMSSIDLHTQYSYQVMLPEAVAIVMAPTDTSRSYGIFRLSDPGGTSVLKQCHESGFHSHEEPPDGSPIYEDCSNVYINSNLRGICSEEKGDWTSNWKENLLFSAGTSSSLAWASCH